MEENKKIVSEMEENKKIKEAEDRIIFKRAISAPVTLTLPKSLPVLIVRIASPPDSLSHPEHTDF